jgi:hypothetical protein
MEHCILNNKTDDHITWNQKTTSVAGMSGESDETLGEVHIKLNAANRHIVYKATFWAELDHYVQPLWAIQHFVNNKQHCLLTGFQTEMVFLPYIEKTCLARTKSPCFFDFYLQILAIIYHQWMEKNKTKFPATPRTRRRLARERKRRFSSSSEYGSRKK